MFDTERYNERLEKAGFNKEQAEVLMNCQHEMIKENFATKLDISELKSEIGRKIDANGYRIKSTNQKIENTHQKIENTKNEMIIKLGGIVVTCTILLGIVLKLN